MAGRVETPEEARLAAAWDVTERRLSEELPRRRWYSQGGVLGARLFGYN
jgi:hypothetical protein